ncbi:MAG TPA: hypothetical protein P5533_05285 [Candidatus Cloacimonadota bacterium]|nr:hypothetical protein [Candidatus Cloacimonadota bacterium]
MEQYPNYSQPPQAQNYSNSISGAPVLTVGNWVVTMLIMCVPIVNIVMLIVWSASSNENPNRKNWAIAQLIFMAVGVVLWILMFGMIAGSMGGFMQALQSMN